MKQCKTCHEYKPLYEYVKSNQAKDGYTSDCKVCYNAKQRATRYSGRTKKVTKYVAPPKQCIECNYLAVEGDYCRRHSPKPLTLEEVLDQIYWLSQGGIIN